MKYSILLIVAATIIFCLEAIIAVPVVHKKQQPKDDWESKLGCSSCKTALQLLVPLLKSNRSFDLLADVAIPVCELIKAGGQCGDRAGCKDVCVGAIHEYGPLVAEVLQASTDTKATVEQVCNVMEVCPDAPHPPPGQVQGIGLVMRSNLSDFSGEKAWPQWQRPATGKGTVVHLTDVHLDSKYVAGFNADCHTPACCRKENGLPGKGQRAAGEYGDYLCDLSPKLFDMLMNQLKTEFADNVDFVVLTGDEPPHDVWKQTEQDNMNSIAAVSGGLLQAFPQVPTFPTIGNHGAAPADMFLGPGKDSWLYNSVSEDWAHWLPDDALRTLRFGGYYAARARPGLRVISLHTTVLTADDLWLRVNATAHDFTGQLAWFNDTMDQVRALGEKAYVIGHARPTEFVEPLRGAFYEIAYRNRDIITGYMFGHVHQAELSLMRMGSDQKAFAVNYAAGSVTPQWNMNPGFRVWDYDRSSTEITGWDSYWMDLQGANNGTLTNPKFEQRYHAPEFFGIDSMQPEAWEQLATKLINDAAAFKAWTTAYYKDGPAARGNPRDYACGILTYDKCPL